MKKLLILLICSFAFSWFDASIELAKDVVDTTSLKKINRKKIQRSRIYNIENEKLVTGRTKAFGTINFEDSDKLVMEKCYENEIFIYPNMLNTKQTVKSAFYLDGEMYEIRFKFTDSNKLWEMQIYSYYDRTADFYETKVKENWQTLLEVIGSSFNMGKGEYPSFSSLHNTYITWSHISDEKDNKKAYLGVWEAEYKYRARLHITYMPIKTILDNKENTEDSISKEKVKSKF